MMGMNTDIMNGSFGGSMMLFGWLIYILVGVALVMAIIALGKYIGRQ
ncbi:MAG: hypothetical protein UX60_C0011G0015 [Berkelbacteria bacterium GW2011_GWA2_46_7]|uniref:Uncharacterized protein n=1 Tax=Berkelbacteria bacterium GW2011_GWA2_46_7 TaxID=1618335 RepID=A0A0G1TF81_9BACT|nr:MAG: hypothetical protein UX60_C0011G0015 [Berkelbacteria bacterium GW2011_GWA2_46_7]